MAGIGPFFTRLQGQYACFEWLIKRARRLLKHTDLNSFGVHFGVRIYTMNNKLCVLRHGPRIIAPKAVGSAGVPGGFE